MAKSKIEWTNMTWNPTTGCTKISQGCKHCYAERIYERFNGNGSFKNVICHSERLLQPLKWKKPSLVFVNSMSDLFHENVPFAFIRQVFQVIEDNPRHTFQILTKRPERLLEFSDCTNHWAPDNVWFGVSVENQKEADERIPLLMQVPAAVRFLSCEPLLSNINLVPFLKCNCLKQTDDTWEDLNSNEVGLFYPVKGYKANKSCTTCNGNGILKKLDWVICGGESGPDARPMHPHWARLLRDQCAVAGVPFFFKQWGEYLFDGSTKGTIEVPEYFEHKGTFKRVGKKKAGNLLDGRQHLEYPKINL